MKKYFMGFLLLSCMGTMIWIVLGGQQKNEQSGN